MDIDIETDGTFMATFPITVKTAEGVAIYVTVILRIGKILYTSLTS